MTECCSVKGKSINTAKSIIPVWVSSEIILMLQDSVLEVLFVGFEFLLFGCLRFDFFAVRFYLI